MSTTPLENAIPEAEVTNPNTRRVILEALTTGYVIIYSYDEKTGRLYVYLDR